MHTLNLSGCGRSASTAIAAVALASSTLHACPPEYEYEMACAPPCGTIKSSATALDINEAGDIVGFTTGFCYQENAFIWKAGTPNLQFLPMPAGTTSSRAYAINDSGQIVGVFVNPANPQGSGGFIIDNGVFTGMGTLPGGNWSEAYDINDAGVAVGFWQNNFSGPPTQGMTWQDGVMTSLTPLLEQPMSVAYGINDAGAITGYLSPKNFLYDGRAFVWDGKQLTVLPPAPGAYTSIGVAINSHGDVAGWGRAVCDPPGEFCAISKAFLWNGADMISLGSLPDFPSIAPGDLNDDQMIVGAMASQFNFNIRAFLWESGKLHILDDLVLGFDGVNIGAGSARAINNAGQIAANVASAAGSCVVRLTPKPTRATDLDCDGSVSTSDLAILIQEWGATKSVADLDGSGQVDGRDMGLLLGDWDG